MKRADQLDLLNSLFFLLLKLFLFTPMFKVLSQLFTQDR